MEAIGTFDSSVDRPRQRTSDGLIRVRDRTGEAAVHIEIERKWRPNLPSRLFDYASSAVTGTRLPVWSIVILLRPGGRPPQDTGTHRIRGIGGDAFVFRYHVVRLWQLDARSMRTELGIEAAPFLVAMRGIDEELVRKLTDEVRTTHRMTQRARESTMRLLVVVTAAMLGSDTARRIFPMEWLNKDPNVQAFINDWKELGRAEGRTKGLAEGRAEGESKGRAKGRAEGRAEGESKGRATEARLLLYKVLAARSFSVTSATRARIERETDTSRLEAWLETAVTARTVRDVFRRR
ncbi:MAG TPA: hypothetical protein VHT91_00435 [Kofleriaceae bacterium]|jgi:hypothetical protein|nr:hypothetical protein [Kofleriaceae bacterium]